MPRTATAAARRDGALSTLVRRAAGAAARRPRRTIAGWILLVVTCLVAGSMTGTRLLDDADTGAGDSRRADRAIAAAGLAEPASETVLVRAADPRSAAAAARELERRLGAAGTVARLTGPRDRRALSAAGGRALLVQVQLRGDPDDAADLARPVTRAVAATASAHPAATLYQVGDGSVAEAFDQVLGDDLRRAELLSLPLTLVILVLAFGALVAALVPLLLGITSVAAALGALGVVSQVLPTDEATATLIVLIGLAVGVDYSLFYVRRVREERRAGRSHDAALDVTAATVGRAVLVSGLTVLVALAGLLFTGLNIFTSMAVATMLVALIAVIGSLTVLPAVLHLLGDRVDRGRVPGLDRRRLRAPAGRRGAWARLAAAVTRRPAVALVLAACALGTLAVPALDLRTASSGVSELPREEPVRVAMREIERVFPGAPATARLVLSGDGLGERREALAALGERARAVTGGRGAVGVDVARDGRTAVIAVPMPERDADAARAVVGRLRDDVAPTASRVAPGTRMLVTGWAAASADFTAQLERTTPLVIGFVLALAFVLLVGAFGSPALAAAVIALNLASVGAAYGVLVGIFQHTWAEGLLGFTSSGTITDWLPLFAFVILFGLSMDYTVLVLERIREARRAGLPAREAAAEGVGATAGTVTSAAVVMVAVFGVFATLSLLQFKQFGIGLAAAILIDATLVRGVALPAVVALLGDRRWPVREAVPARAARAAAGRWMTG